MLKSLKNLAENISAAIAASSIALTIIGIGMLVWVCGSLGVICAIGTSLTTIYAIRH